MANTTEAQLEGNLTVVTSSIELNPERDDNNTVIICEAKNTELQEKSTKEITLHVHCKCFVFIVGVVFFFCFLSGVGG